MAENHNNRRDNHNNRSRNNNQQRRQRHYGENEHGEFHNDYSDHREQQHLEKTKNNRQRQDSYNRRPRQQYDDYAPQYPKRSFKKPLIIGLSALGGIAIAAGLASYFSGSSTAQIVTVAPNYISTQQPYQDCHRVSGTRYVRNQKNGTEGALIGGATGAVAGGIIGNQVKQGGGGTAVGAVVGGATGALIGRDVQRSNQPDYVARKTSGTQCETRYKTVQTQSGYNVQYLYKGNMASIVTQAAPAIGIKLPYNQLQAMAMPTQQATQATTATPN